MSDAQILQILGLAYLSVGLGALINPEFYKKILTAYTKNLPVIYLNSFIIFGIGFLLVSFHNVWVFDWPVLVTVLGWTAFLKGVFLCYSYQSEKMEIITFTIIMKWGKGLASQQNVS